MKYMICYHLCLNFVSLLLFGSMPVKGSTQCDFDWIPSTSSIFCYKVILEAITWHDASVYCRQIGSELASISDESEQNFIEALISTRPENPYFWIGGTKQTQDGSWQWTDNTPFRYSNRLPDSIQIGVFAQHLGNCAIIGDWSVHYQAVPALNNFQWVDAKCMYNQHFICKKTGTNLNECASNPCKNGATCHNGQNEYSCTCTVGWHGFNCDQDLNECASNPCKNGATCHNGQNEYSCTCTVGWHGFNCDQDKDQCADGIDQCSSNARCDNTPGSFTCTCDWGFKGDGDLCIPQLEYRCNPDDSIHLFNLPDDSNIFAMQDVANGNDTPCLVSNENTTTVTLTGCSKDEEIIITYGQYSGLATYKVHSGKSVVVTFKCLEIAQEGVIKQINSSYSAQLTVDERISVDPLYSVTSSLSSTSTTVGHEILWTILFPEHYSLEVTSCTAYPGLDDSSNDFVALISNGGCSATMDLISNFNSYINGTATARLLAFKFHNIASVFLKCSLKVCPPGSTPTACTTTCSKEKRSVQKRKSGKPTSIVPVTISNVLYVTDAHSSGIIEVPTTWIAIFTVMQVLTRNAKLL